MFATTYLSENPRFRFNHKRNKKKLVRLDILVQVSVSEKIMYSRYLLSA